jgi:AraC-like DNA-binding protein
MRRGKKRRPVPANAIVYPGQRVLRLPEPVKRDMLRDPLTANQLLTAVGYFPHAVRHFYERPQGADKTVVLYCVRGRGWGKLNGRRVEVQAGDLLVLPPNQPHSYGADDDDSWTIYWLHAEGRQIALLASEIVATARGPLVRLGEVPAIVRLFNDAFDHLAESYARVSLIAASLSVANLLGEILCRQRNAQFETEDTSERIEHTLEIMRTRISGQVSVAELAAAANLSESRFAVLFKMRTGYSVKNFFLGLKMRHGCHLLDTSKLSIKAIATELGFSDQLYFSRMFRKIQGLSPKDYRAIKKG